MPDNMERIVAEVSPELKHLVDADKRDNREVVEAALWREFGGERQGALERRQNELKEHKELLQDQIENRSEEIKEIEGELNAIEQQLSEKDEKNEQHWKEAVGNITPTNSQKRLSSYDAETWAPNPENQKVQIYADRLEITPEEFCERFPEKRREYDAI